MAKILVFIMLSLVAQLFSGSTQADVKTYPRKINLSGNIFHFSMPEDFSKDMPAYDMVERLDISDPEKFDDPEYGNLIRRWWDIKEPGWFGKSLGTVMMDISVQRVVENKQNFIHSKSYDIKNRMDFMLMLDDGFHQRYDSFNSGVPDEEQHINTYHSILLTVSGRKISSLYRDKPVNSQHWTEYSIMAPRTELITIFSIPVTDQTYLEVSFSYSHNHDVLPRELTETAQAKVGAIVNSLKIDYVERNPFAEVVGKDWESETTNDVLEKHRNELIKRFYGPDPEAALLKDEQENREADERYRREAQEILRQDPL